MLLVCWKVINRVQSSLGETCYLYFIQSCILGRWGDFFYKGPDGKVIRPCRPFGLCPGCSWWLCPSKTQCSEQTAVQIRPLSVSNQCFVFFIYCVLIGWIKTSLAYCGFTLFSVHVSEKLNTVVPLFMSSDCSPKRFCLCASCLLPQ